jgi:hypothetical protein
MRSNVGPEHGDRIEPLFYVRIEGTMLFRTNPRFRTAQTVAEVQRSFKYSDEHLAQCCDVRVETVRSWQRGEEEPSAANLRRMKELLRLNEALVNARSGKYRQA